MAADRKPCPKCTRITAGIRHQTILDCTDCDSTGTVPEDEAKYIAYPHKTEADPNPRLANVRPSQPDPAGQTFEDVLISVMSAVQADNYAGIPLAPILDAHEADREAFARKEVVKALVDLKRAITARGLSSVRLERQVIELIDRAVAAEQESGR